jgi:hypothetical protein
MEEKKNLALVRFGEGFPTIEWNKSRSNLFERQNKKCGT